MVTPSTVEASSVARTVASPSSAGSDAVMPSIRVALDPAA
jgi:hypothetical protein